MSLLTKIFGDANEKYLRKLQPIVEKINQLENQFESFSDEELKNKTQELKERIGRSLSVERVNEDLFHLSSDEWRLANNAGDERSLAIQAALDRVLPEAFALVREAAKRTLGQRHFDVQLIGGIVLHQGKITEMKTGEGKTLVATLPLFLNALEGKGCHLVTVNDYLARRDTVWMGQIYHALGLSVGCLNHEQSFLYDPEYKKPSKEKEKKRDELGSFYVVEDFLRPCSRKEAYLADITYGTNNEFGFDYLRDNMVYDLSQKVQRDFNFAIIDEVDSILIDEARTPLIISAPDTESSKWYQDFARIIPKLTPQIDYQIDEKMKTVTLTEEGINKVEKILGMGNIYEEKKIKYLHHLEQSLRAEALFKRDRDYVVKNGQVIIIDEFTGRLMPGRRWSGGLHQAIEAKEGVKIRAESLTLATITFQNYFRMYKKLAGMTGTAVTSAEEFEKIYNLQVVIVPTNKPIIRKDLPDLVFKTEKGKFQALIKEIKARYKRGQPILLGTRSVEKNEYLAKLLDKEGIPHQILNAKNHEKEAQIIAQAGKLGAVTVATNMAGRRVDIILGGYPPSKQKKPELKNPDEDEEYKKWQEEHDRVISLGGLHVIGTERHEARRIDNQLRGRAGRQGDPGSSQFFLSLEDDLMRIFGGDRIKSLMSFLKIPEDEPIEAKMVSGVIESAQSKIEGMNFDLRKHLLDYDDVLNKHREVIYKKRREFLTIENWKLEIGNWIKDDKEKKLFEQKEKELGNSFNQLAKFIALKTLDMLWVLHLEEMEELRDSVKLRAYGQKDPLVEYKNEGHRMFQQLLKMIENNIVQALFRVSLKDETNVSVVSSRHQESVSSVSAMESKRVGRNDPCPCGSGKKYKKCHGN